MATTPMLCALLVVAPLSGAPLSQEPVPRGVPQKPVPGQDEPEAAAQDAEATLKTSLDDYVYEVLHRYLGLKIAMKDQEIATTGVELALGEFDPELFTIVSGADNEIPSASLFQASTTQTFNADLGVQGLLRSGATYSLTYGLDYARQSPTNPFFSFNPQATSAVLLSLRQPLLRGAGPTVTEAGLERARLNVERSDHELLVTVHNTAFLAVSAYWNLVFELRRRDTARTAVEVAQELVNNNRRKMEAGVMTRLDVLTAEAEAARREEELIQAENQLARATDVVMQLLSPGEEVSAWEVLVIPTTEPRLRDEPLPEAEQAIRTALERRDDLAALNTDFETADLNLWLAERNALPLLDITGSYGLSGLGGQFRGTDPVSGQPVFERDSNWDMVDESLTPIFESQYERWSVGLEARYPIGNRSAKAVVRETRMAKDRAGMAISQLRMNIVQETRAALRDVADARARTQAARAARVLAEQQYEAEKVRLENEFSTTFEVREAQRDWLEAIDNETRAIVNYEIQLAKLLQVQGILADQHGLELFDLPPAEGAIYEEELGAAPQ